VAIFTLSCDGCGFIDEYVFDALEENKHCPCEKCGDVLYTKQNRIYLNDIPQINGETVSKGMSYNYYDESLDVHITSKQHRKDEMKRKGLTDYHPDPKMKAHRDEARYIRERSKPGDADARAAIQKEYKTAIDTRRERNLRTSLDGSFKKLGL